MRLLSTFVLLVLLVPTLGSHAAAAEAPKVRRSELKAHSFAAGPLLITVAMFRPHIRDNLTFRRSAGQVVLRVTNGSDVVARFEPQEMIFVGSDGRQATLRGRLQRGFVDANEDRVGPLVVVPIAPGALVDEMYELTGPVRLPARLYYGDALLAEIDD